MRNWYSVFGRERTDQALTQAKLLFGVEFPSESVMLSLMLRDVIKEVEELKDEIKILRNDRKPE